MQHFILGPNKRYGVILKFKIICNFLTLAGEKSLKFVETGNNLIPKWITKTCFVCSAQQLYMCIHTLSVLMVLTHQSSTSWSWTRSASSSQPSWTRSCSAWSLCWGGRCCGSPSHTSTASSCWCGPGTVQTHWKWSVSAGLSGPFHRGRPALLSYCHCPSISWCWNTYSNLILLCFKIHVYV